MDNIVDAYKSLIDFSKTIIAISSSVLTAQIAYIVYQNIDLTFWNWISILSVIGAIFLSLFGFGKAIETVKDGKSRKEAIFMTNVGGFLMMIGIILILSFNAKKSKTVDQILNHIKQSTYSLNKKLIPSNLKSIELLNNNYLVQYSIDSIQVSVIYSIKDDEIISLK